MSALETHFSMLSPDADRPQEDVVQTLLGVLGYSAQSIRLHPTERARVLRHMRSEYLRVKAMIR